MPVNHPGWLILTAAKIGKRLYAESRRLRRLKRSLSQADIKRVLKEEGLDIVGDLYTFIDPEASIADMAWAVADLALGTDFNNRTAAVRRDFLEGRARFTPRAASRWPGGWCGPGHRRHGSRR